MTLISKSPGLRALRSGLLRRGIPPAPGPPPEPPLPGGRPPLLLLPGRSPEPALAMTSGCVVRRRRGDASVACVCALPLVMVLQLQRRRAAAITVTALRYTCVIRLVIVCVAAGPRYLLTGPGLGCCSTTTSQPTHPRSLSGCAECCTTAQSRVSAWNI